MGHFRSENKDSPPERKGLEIKRSRKASRGKMVIQVRESITSDRKEGTSLYKKGLGKVKSTTPKS